MSDGNSRLDDVDRRIVAALQIDPRLPWSHVARAIGVSETTVVRRAQRLLEQGALAVVAVPHGPQCGMGHPVVLHLRTAPGRAAEVADAIAQRTDVRFVALLAGREDIVCEMLVPDHAYLARVLLSEIRTDGWITQITTELVLRTFKTSYDWSRALLGDHAADLYRHEPVKPRRRSQQERRSPLDHVDFVLMAALTENGRRSYADLAGELDMSETTVARRVSRLTSMNYMHIGTLVDPRALGYEIEAFIRLRVETSAIESVASALVELPEVRYLSATSGYSDLLCETVLHDNDALYEFTTEVLGRLSGIKQVETNLELATVKRAFRHPPVSSIAHLSASGGSQTRHAV